MQQLIENYANFNTLGTMWIWFIPIALITIFLTIKMVRNAEIIIIKTKFGAAFIGGVLIAFVTSSPELFTSIFQGLNGKPEIALANQIGANMLSTTMLVLINLFFLKKMLLTKLDSWSKWTIFISWLLSSILLLFMLLKVDIKIGTSKSLIFGLVPIIFVISYIGYIFLSYKFDKNDSLVPKQTLVSEQTLTTSKNQAIIKFVGYSCLLICSSWALNLTINAMQSKYQLSANSSGGILLSLVTTIPEIVTIFFLLKHNHVIVAIASIMGSHIFNFSTIFWTDLAFVDGAIFEMVKFNSLWILGLTNVILLTMLLIFVIICKKVRHKYFNGVFLIMIVSTYFLSWIPLFLL